MKKIALILGCVFLGGQIAYSVAPLQIKTIAESIVAGFINVPFHQAVKSSGYNVKIETGNYNMLIDGGFEGESPEFDHWNELGAKGQWQKETSECLEGNCLTLQASNDLAAGSLQQTINLSAEQIGVSYSANLWVYKDPVNDEGLYEVCVNNTCSDIIHNGWYEYRFAGYTTASNKVLIRPKSAYVNGKLTDLVIDRFEFAISNLNSTHEINAAANVSKWESYTPTITGLGTLSNLEAKYRIVGDSVDIKIKATSGNRTSDQARIYLPSIFTVTSSYITTQAVGNLNPNLTTEAHYSVLASAGDNYLTIGARSGAGGSLYSKLNGNQMLANNAVFSIDATIEITELQAPSATETLDRYNTNAREQYFEVETQVGLWNGEKLYRRCHTVTTALTASGNITNWGAGLKPKGIARYYNTGVVSLWAISFVTTAIDQSIIAYDDISGNVDAIIDSPYRIGAGTSFCMEYTK